MMLLKLNLSTDFQINGLTILIFVLHCFDFHFGFGHFPLVVLGIDFQYFFFVFQIIIVYFLELNHKRFIQILEKIILVSDFVFEI